jgi:hypothetical protein
MKNIFWILPILLLSGCKFDFNHVHTLRDETENGAKIIVEKKEVKEINVAQIEKKEDPVLHQPKPLEDPESTPQS